MGPAESALNARMRLIDSHAHLQADAFADDADAVLAAAAAAGVERLLDPGWDVASSSAALEVARRHAWVDAAVGVHPHVASQVDDAGWSVIVGLASDASVVAVGETGLDYDRAFSPRPAQLANLRRNLALALATRKPAVIHCRSSKGARDAQDELIAELHRAGLGGEGWREAFGGRPPALLHSFSGPVDYAEAALELGLAVSFSGLVFRAGEEPSAAVARLVPADRLLVETDSPYLSPPGAARRRNEPSWVALTAHWLAEQRGQDPVTIGDQLVANYDRIFRRSDSWARRRMDRRGPAAIPGLLGRLARPGRLRALRPHPASGLGRAWRSRPVGDRGHVGRPRDPRPRPVGPPLAPEGRTRSAGTLRGRAAHRRPASGAARRAVHPARARRHGGQTTAADRCFIGVWEGYGWLADSGWPAAPALVLDQRTFLVRRGPLERGLTVGSRSQGDAFVAEPPTLLWPADRAWFVASDPDLDSTYVGGSAVLIESLLHLTELEAWPVGPGDLVAIGSDVINGS